MLTTTEDNTGFIHLSGNLYRDLLNGAPQVARSLFPSGNRSEHQERLGCVRNQRYVQVFPEVLNGILRSRFVRERENESQLPLCVQSITTSVVVHRPSSDKSTKHRFVITPSPTSPPSNSAGSAAGAIDTFGQNSTPPRQHNVHLQFCFSF